MILPSAQKPNHKEMQVIHLDQDMQVCGIFYIVPILYIFGTPYIMTLSLFGWVPLFQSMGYLYFFTFFLFFSSCSLACIFSLRPFGMDILF
jgi:hypothetical protein